MSAVNIVLNVLGTSTVLNALGNVRDSLAGMAAMGISATAALGAVGNTLETGVRFNAQIESARLGVAAVLKQFDDAEKFKSFDQAIDASAEAIERLKQKALSSPASFSSLVQAYQATVGPMTAANIALGNQVDLIVAMSQALAGLGIHESQILQETRALITGNINADAAAAKILGITSADISQAKAKGELYQFLASKIAAFAEAGDRGSRSLNTLKANLGDAFEQRSADATEKLNDALKGFYEQLTVLVNSQEFQQFVGVFANSAAGLVGGITNVAEALGGIPFSGLANLGIAGGTILGAGVAVKLVSKLDHAVLDWATRAGSPAGQAFAGRFLAPLTSGLTRFAQFTLPALIGFELGRAIGNAIKQWREAPALEARSGDAPVISAINEAGAIDSEKARVAALEKLVALQKEITTARTAEASKLISSNDALQIYAQQLLSIRGTIDALNSAWAQQRIGFNLAAGAAAKVARAEADAAAWLKSDIAEKARDMVAAAIEERTDPAERLESARAFLAISERTLAIAKTERDAGRNTAQNQKLILETTAARESTLRDIAALEERIARTTAEQAQMRLNVRLRMISQQRAELEGDFTRTDADKWGERKRLLDDEIAAQTRYVDVLQQRLEATNDVNARATLMGDISGGLDKLSSLDGERAQLGPDPHSFMDQMKAGMAQLRNEWGTLQQQMAGGLTGAIRTGVDGVTHALTRWSMEGGKFWNLLGNVRIAITQEIVGAIAGMVVRWVAGVALMGLRWIAMKLGIFGAEKSMAAASVAATLPLAMAQSAIWITPATLATIASAGTAAAAAPGFMAASIMASKPLALASEGGFFPGDRSQVRGLFHGDEFIFSAPAVDAIGLDTLAAMHDAARSGSRPAAAAAAGGAPGAGGASAEPMRLDLGIEPLDTHAAIQQWAETRRGRAYLINLMTGVVRQVSP